MAQIVACSGYRPERKHLEMLMPALNIGGEMSYPDVLERIMNNKAQLWLVRENAEVVATALSEVVDYPRTSALRIIAIGGEGMERWQQDLYNVMYGFCVTNKLSRIETICRPGLERIMKPLGFSKKFVCLFHEVQNGENIRYN